LDFISVALNKIKIIKMKINYFLIIAVLFQSCLLPKKLDKFFDKKPVLAAQKCAEKFPIKETIDTIIVVDSATLQAYEMEFVYLYSMLDSLLGNQVSDSVKREIVTVFQEKKVPVIKYKYITRTVENTAKIKFLTDSCSSLSDSLSKELDESNIRLDIASGESIKYRDQRNKSYLWVLFLLLLLFRKPIALLFSKLVK
jgi:hypothetical protein